MVHPEVTIFTYISVKYRKLLKNLQDVSCSLNLSFFYIFSSIRKCLGSPVLSSLSLSFLSPSYLALPLPLPLFSFSSFSPLSLFLPPLPAAPSAPTLAQPNRTSPLPDDASTVVLPWFLPSRAGVLLWL